MPRAFAKHKGKFVNLNRIGFDSLMPNEKQLAKKHGIVIKKPLDFIRIAYLNGPIFFSSVEQINSKLADLDGASVLILSMRGVPFIDTSGIMEFYALLGKLKASNCKLIFCGLQKQVSERLQRSGIIDEIGKDMVFWSAEQAISFAQNMDE